MKGRAWKFGNDIDTDIIVPGRYLIYTDEETLASHCMEGLDPDFSEKCKKGISLWPEPISDAVPQGNMLQSRLKALGFQP